MYCTTLRTQVELKLKCIHITHVYMFMYFVDKWYNFPTLFSFKLLVFSSGSFSVASYWPDLLIPSYF